VLQLRQSADASVDPSWRLPVVDASCNICSVLEPIGPVLVFGPNNFPLAYNGISGGDFATAIAAGNPVIAKAHPLHPQTTRLLAELAAEAIGPDLPPAIVQMVYGMSNDDGLRAVADPRLGAVGFTGSRHAGTALKQSADTVGKPIFLEMSSINPVVLLPGALAERFDDVLNDATTSGLMASGQFCTNPGLMLMLAGEDTERFIAGLVDRYRAAPCATLLGEGVMQGLTRSVAVFAEAGVELLAGGAPVDRPGFAFENTILRATGDAFLSDPLTLQTEAFGNCTLLVVANDVEQICQIIATLEGNLTGSIYSATDGSEDAMYDRMAPLLRERVGRLLNDKMPTGVAVSPAMNHGGPFPATGHPHFTAVGIPAALRRFTRLACYDNVRKHRLPPLLQS
jgi:NADP-dependent aldehyde dehydrogenase